MSEGIRAVDSALIDRLRDNPGQYFTAEILAAATDYSEGYVRERLHVLADSDDTTIEKDRRYKEIYGVLIGNNFVVITDDRDQLLDIVKQYRPSEYDAARAMSKQDLRSFIIDEIADREVTTKTDKLYFGAPS
jgi:hypothetical protein